MPFRRNTPAQKALKKLVAQAGADPRAWTPEQSREHAQLIGARQDEILDEARQASQ